MVLSKNRLAGLCIPSTIISMIAAVMALMAPAALMASAPMGPPSTLPLCLLQAQVYAALAAALMATVALMASPLMMPALTSSSS